MKFLGKRLIIVIAVIVALTFIAPLAAAATPVGNSEISSLGAVILDFETNTVLFSHNEAVQRVPASMIKIIAVYVVYDAIKDGKATLDTRIPISAGVSEFSRDKTWSNVPLAQGETHSVRELIEVVIVRSACAATVALGEGIFGSERAMVERMNAKARDMNIRASFHDSWGGSQNNRISPLALAWLVRALLQDHPEVLKISAMREVTFDGAALSTSNFLLARYPGADGLKTGFTNPAGYCLIGTAERNGRRLITVTMGNSLETRYDDTVTLLDYGFENADRIIGSIAGDNDNETDNDRDTTIPALPPLPPASGGKVLPSTANLIVNGEQRPLSAYNIGGSHYFKLRDIAYLLSGTDVQFEVLWDEDRKTIGIVSGEPYTPVGGELEIAAGTARQYAQTASDIFVDGEQQGFGAYHIEGNNFFRLRDIAGLMGFDVDWNETTLTVIINTN